MPLRKPKFGSEPMTPHFGGYPLAMFSDHFEASAFAA